MLSSNYFREILYFASEVFGSHFTWFRCKASKQHSDNRLIYYWAQCSQLKHVTGMPWIWQRSTSPAGWQRKDGALAEGISFYSTSRSIRAMESALCTLLIDSLRLHRCRRTYNFSQAVPHFHSIKFSYFPLVSIMEQLFPLLYFILQSAPRPVLWM